MKDYDLFMNYSDRSKFSLNDHGHSAWARFMTHLDFSINEHSMTEQSSLQQIMVVPEKTKAFTITVRRKKWVMIIVAGGCLGPYT